MNLSGIFTTALSVIAAWQGVGGSPAATSRRDATSSTEANLTGISNRPIPSDVEAALQRNYGACLQRLDQNPRITGSMTKVAIKSVCAAEAGVGTAFEKSLESEMPGDTLKIRSILHRQLEGRSENPLGDIESAGHSPKRLLEMNFGDYKESQTSYYARNLAEQVAFLDEYIPAAARGSLEDAWAALEQPTSWKAWVATSDKWVRAEIAKRTVFADMRGVLKPESMDRVQLQELKDDLQDMQFGPSSLKRRMVNDALAELVRQHHQASTVAPA